MGNQKRSHFLFSVGRTASNAKVKRSSRWKPRHESIYFCVFQVENIFANDQEKIRKKQETRSEKTGQKCFIQEILSETIRHQIFVNWRRNVTQKKFALVLFWNFRARSKRSKELKVYSFLLQKLQFLFKQFFGRLGLCFMGCNMFLTDFYANSEIE